MSQQSVRLTAWMVSLLVILIWTTSPISAQYGAENGEWHFNGGDAGNTRYSPLDQINIGGESPESSGFPWKQPRCTLRNCLASWPSETGPQPSPWRCGEVS